MYYRDLTISFTVDQSPDEVFDAINNVRGWWSGEIDGRTDEPDAEFTYRCKDVHRSTQKITEWVPGRKIVWRVLASETSFVDDKTEWDRTDIVFEITRKGSGTELRFTHVGMVPAIQCYAGCARAWDFHINRSLRSLITTGKGQPDRKETQRRLRYTGMLAAALASASPSRPGWRLPSSRSLTPRLCGARAEAGRRPVASACTPVISGPAVGDR
jgi:hypothetical protein